MNGFSIRNIISSAWKNVRGVKWPIWLVLIVLALIGFGVSLIAGLVTMSMGLPMIHTSGTSAAPSFTHVIDVSMIIILFEIIMLFLTSPLTAGAQMAALKKVRGEAVSATTGFGYWNKWFRLGLTILLFSVGTMIVYFIFSMLSTLSSNAELIWLSIAFNIIGSIAFVLYYTFFVFNILLVADKDKGPWCALGCSAKAVAPHWFRVFLLFIYIGILFVVALIPGVLGLICPYLWVKVVSVIVSIVLLIWVVPYAHTIFSTIYNKLSAHN